MVKKFWFEAKNINCFKDDFRVIKDIPTPTAFSSVNLTGNSLTEVYNVNFDGRGFPQDCVIAYGSGTGSGDIVYIHDAFT